MMSHWEVVNLNVASLLTLLIIGLSTSVMAHTHQQRDPSDLFTTLTPAVPDILGSGRNGGPLRPGRRVGFRSLVAGLADDISRGYIFFCNPSSS